MKTAAKPPKRPPKGKDTAKRPTSGGNSRFTPAANGKR